jgi:hypothetical protein
LTKAKEKKKTKEKKKKKAGYSPQESQGGSLGLALEVLTRCERRQRTESSSQTADSIAKPPKSLALLSLR